MFSDLSRPVVPVGQPEVDDLGELGELNIVQNDERAVDAGHRLVRDPETVGRSLDTSL